MADMDLMLQKYPTIIRDPNIRCGICDPFSMQNRITGLRYDTALFTATLSGAAPNVMTFASQTRDFFSSGKGEPLDGLATVDKTLAETNLDDGGSAVDSPCLFTAYSVSVELQTIAIWSATGDVSLLPSYYYDQAYNRAILDKLSNLITFKIIESNGCTDDGGVIALWPSDGSSRDTGDRNRSGMLGVTRGLRTTICFPGQNAKRPRITLTLERDLAVTENGANPFDAVPEGSVLAVAARVVVEGAVETPP